MNEIGKNFKTAREDAGLSLKEVEKDTGIPASFIEQIEEGSIGSFKDIFVLRDYLTTYAKYLVMDESQVLDKFNEYMFEYTTKLPTERIEKEMKKQKLKEEKEEDTSTIKISTPYLSFKEKNSYKNLIISLVIIVILVIITLIWAVNMVYR